jgi:hypothetical protein
VRFLLFAAGFQTATLVRGFSITSCNERLVVGTNRSQCDRSDRVERAYGDRACLLRILHEKGFIHMPRRKSKTSKRRVLKPHKGDRRYLRRNKQGEFKKEVNVGRSLSVDRRRSAKTKVKKGQGDRGDT